MYKVVKNIRGVVRKEYHVLVLLGDPSLRNEVRYEIFILPQLYIVQDKGIDESNARLQALGL